MPPVMFKLVVRRNKKAPGIERLFREQEIVIPIDLADDGFSIEIHHLAHARRDEEPMKLQGFVGTDVLSTTVEFKGSPRVKRTTPRL